MSLVSIFLRLFELAKNTNSSLSNASGIVTSLSEKTFPFCADVNFSTEWSYPTLNLSAQIPVLPFKSMFTDALSFSVVTEDATRLKSLFAYATPEDTAIHKRVNTISKIQRNFLKLSPTCFFIQF